MSSFTVSGDVQVDGFGFPLSKSLKFTTGVKKIAAQSLLANRKTLPVSAGRSFVSPKTALGMARLQAMKRLSGDNLDAIYGGDYLGATLFQKFLSKTIVGKALTKIVGKVPIVGGVAQTALTTYRDANVQQPKVSVPAKAPLTVASVTSGAQQPRKAFPVVPVAIGAGVLLVGAVFFMSGRKRASAPAAA